MFRLYQKLRIIGALALVAMAGGNTLAQHRLNSDSGRRMPRTQQLPDPLALREFDQRSNEMNAIPSDDGDRPFDQTNSVQQIRELSKRAIGDYKTIDAVFLQCYFETLPTLLQAGDDAIPPAPDETEWSSLSDTSPLEPNPSPGNFCEPVFNHVACNDCCYGVQNWSPLLRRLGVDATGCEEPGIGHERVMFAPFEIDPTQPTNYWLVRYDSGFGLRTPDRAEYFWSKPGKAPAMSRDQINFQDLRFINETGSDSFSVITEIPVRFIDADSLHSTSGIGDMKVATKLRLINGQKWQVTQILRTYINTGSARKGVGAGHLSLEPGLLARYELSPDTYLHSECKLWVPIAGDPVFSGNVLRSGLGISHVLYETDRFAIIPNLEMVNFTYLTGQKTVGTRSPRVNGEAAINLMPGARFVFGPKGDLGLFELGVSGLVGLGDEYVNQMFRVDFKLSY